MGKTAGKAVETRSGGGRGAGPVCPRNDLAAQSVGKVGGKWGKWGSSDVSTEGRFTPQCCVRKVPTDPGKWGKWGKWGKVRTIL